MAATQTVWSESDSLRGSPAAPKRQLHRAVRFVSLQELLIAFSVQAVSVSKLLL